MSLQVGGQCLQYCTATEYSWIIALEIQMPTGFLCAANLKPITVFYDSWIMILGGQIFVDKGRGKKAINL